jgi:hypothetical protein
MRYLAVGAVLAAAVGLSGCTEEQGPPGNITGVHRVFYLPPAGASGDAAQEAREQARLIQDRPQQFRVTGTGTCRRLRVHFGDGTSTVLWNGNLEWDGSIGTGAIVNHTYASGSGQWRGLKTVRAEPVENCTGEASVEVNVLPAEMRFAFAQPGPICGVIGSVRAGTVINAAPIKNPEDKIRFSFFETRGIAGAPDAALGPPFLFPFPGLRAYSLVYRVGGPGGQVGQGGTGVPFTADRDGTLELCINDDLPTDNSGAWGIFLMVDERNAR